MYIACKISYLNVFLELSVLEFVLLLHTYLGDNYNYVPNYNVV